MVVFLCYNVHKEVLTLAFELIKDFFKKSNPIEQEVKDLCEGTKKLSLMELVIEQTVDLISNTVARTEFTTYTNGKRSPSVLGIRLNKIPNGYQTSQLFIKRLTKDLLLHGEALIVKDGDNSLHLADSFNWSWLSYDTREFTNTTVNGIPYKKKLSQSDVIFIELDNSRLVLLLRRFSRELQELLDVASNSFANNKTKRFAMVSETYRAQLTEVQSKFNELLERNLLNFASGGTQAKVYSLPKGVELKDFSDNQLQSSSDVRGLTQDVYNTVSSAFHVPVSMLLGQQPTSNERDEYLLNAVFPIIDTITNSVNNHEFTLSQQNKGTLVKANKTKLKLVDLVTLGNFISQVLPTGTITLGEIAEDFLNVDRLPQELADLRLITKNYAKVDDFLKSDTVGTTQPTNLEQDEGENDNGEN